MVLARTFRNRPRSFVSTPGPLMVELEIWNPVAPVLCGVAKLAVELVISIDARECATLNAADVTEPSESAPAPAIDPAVYANVPPFTRKVSPAATVIPPVVVKLGVVPLWLKTRSPP